MGIGPIDMDRSDRKAPGRVSAGFSSAGRKGPFASGRSQERRSREPQLMPTKSSWRSRRFGCRQFSARLGSRSCTCRASWGLGCFNTSKSCTDSFTDAFCSGISGIGCWSSEFHWIWTPYTTGYMIYTTQFTDIQLIAGHSKTSQIFRFPHGVPGEGVLIFCWETAGEAYEHGATPNRITVLPSFCPLK